MRRPRRIHAHPLTRLERGAPLAFHHDGRAVPAFEGEPLAAALYASNRIVLARSMRYHRARGLWCGTGGCTHCFVRLDGVPNVRACQALPTPATWSETQNAWPTARLDLLAAADLAFPRYLDAHTGFTRPRAIRSAFTAAARRMAGFGRAPAGPVPQTFRREDLRADILVVGAGPAGLSAARAAAEAGANVVLADAHALPGGRLRRLTTPFLHTQPPGAPDAEGKAWADDQARAAEAAGAHLRPRTRVYGVYDGTWDAATPTARLRIRPRRVILAPGSIDALPMVANADRAGVLLADAALGLTNLHGILPPEPVVIVGATRDGLLLARDLAACGGDVAGVYDAHPRAPAPAGLLHDARKDEVPVLLDHRATHVTGRGRPRRVAFDTPAGRVRVACGAVVFALGRAPLPELAQQAGARLHVTAHGVRPIADASGRTTATRVWVAGSLAGAADPWTSVLSGIAAGTAAAASLGVDDAATETLATEALA